MGKKGEHKITSTVGHIYSLDFPSQYSNWEAVEPISLFDAETIKKESETSSKANIVQHLKQEAKNVDYVVLWLDCDRFLP